jgi:hypothetical protein
LGDSDNKTKSSDYNESNHERWMKELEAIHFESEEEVSLSGTTVVSDDVDENKKSEICEIVEQRCAREVNENPTQDAMDCYLEIEDATIFHSDIHGGCLRENYYRKMLPNYMKTSYV